MNIVKPTFIVDAAKCMANIERMAQKAANSHITFRPHFKTHQSKEIGLLYKQFGVTKITVSSVDMAIYFAKNGWKDITIAFPANILEIDNINKLAKNTQLNLVVESVETITFLKAKLKYPIGIFIKIDTGYHRTGLEPNQLQEILSIEKEITSSKQLKFEGLLSHAGHTYQAKNEDEIRDIFLDTKKKLQQIREQLLSKDVMLSVGDTPACSVMTDFSGLNEIRPGNFVYYDSMQYQLGSCSISDISAVVACPVVAKHPERNELLVYGGGVHFSKEQVYNEEYKTHYGLVVTKKGEKWGELEPNTYLKKISQEHGIIHAPTNIIENTKIGDVLYIVPAHSCLSANLLKSNTHIFP